MMLVLSLFPGIGLLDMAFDLEGFCIVRGPDLLWGGDIRRFHPPEGRFDGVIGGPPCQAFSRLAHLVRANGYEVAENLIPEYERVVFESQPAWFLMENVPDAPVPNVPGYQVRAAMVSNRDDCGAEQSRIRRFSFGTRDGRALELDWPPPPVPLAFARAVTASDGGRSVPVAIGGSGRRKSSKGAKVTGGDPHAGTVPLSEALRLQGLPATFLAHSPLTESGKRRVIGNGVPLSMGRVVARAVRRALSLPPLGISS